MCRVDAAHVVPKARGLGVPTGQVHFVIDSTESQAGEDHRDGFMKVFFKIELSKSKRSRVPVHEGGLGTRMDECELKVWQPAKFKFFAVSVVDAEIVLHCVGMRDNVTGICRQGDLAVVVDAVALALTRSGSEVRRGLGCQSLE